MHWGYQDGPIILLAAFNLDKFFHQLPMPAIQIILNSFALSL